MKKRQKRILVFVLAFSMMFSSLTAFATETATTPARLKIYGTDFKVDNGVVQSNYSKLVADGGSFAVTAVGDNFIGWMDASNNKMMSRSADYSISVSGATTYVAVYNSAENNTAYVEYVNSADQVMQAESYGVDSDIVEPEVPTRPGYTNGRWAFTAQEIKNKIANGEKAIKVTPEYDMVEAYYSVTLVYDGDVENADVITDLANNSFYTAVAKDVEGKKFAYWSNAAENGDILSYQKSYSVRASRNKVLYAIYVDESETVIAQPTIGLTRAFSDGKGAMTWETYPQIPEGYTLVNHGVLRSHDSAYSTTETLTYANKEKIRDYSSSTTLGYSTYNVTIPESAWNSIRLYIRPYMVVKDASGNQITVEAKNVWTYTYQEWKDFEASTEVALAESIEVPSVMPVNSVDVARMKVYGTAFKINDGVVQSNYSKLVADGESFTVTAVGDNFIGWMDASNNKMMSRSASYTISVSGATTYVAVYNSAESNTAYVEYVNSADQVMQAETYGVSSDIAEPEVPTRPGYTNGRWEFGTQDIKDKIANGEKAIKVTPKYDMIEASYSLTLVYDGDADSIEVITDLANNSYYTAVAKDVEGKKFAYWSNAAENGDILSYQESYSVRASRNKILYAIYVDESETVTVQPTIGLTRAFSDGKGAMTWETYPQIPEGYTLVNHGVLRSHDSAYSTTETLTYANKEKIRDYSSSTTLGYSTYNVTIPESAWSSITLYIRPYMVVKDALGNQITVEAKNVWTYSYADWKALEESGELDIPVVPDKEPIQGTEEYPYDMYTTEMETETVEIAAGTDVYYNVYLNGTLFLSVNGSDAYVIYNGETYNAVDGVVTVEISGSRWMPALVQIGNNGADAKVYPVSFAMPLGTMDNPEVVTLGEHKATLETGSQGYFYKYVAEEDGTLEITMKDTNWSYTINNKTTSAYGDTQWSDSDPVVNPATIEVTKGDEIQIIVNTYDPANPYGAPAGEINWSIDYVVDGPGLGTGDIVDDGMDGGDIF